MANDSSPKRGMTKPRTADLPEAIDTHFVRKGAERISRGDVENVTKRASDIGGKSSRGPLRRYLEDLDLLISLVRDYWSGDYRTVPYRVIAAIVFALLYVVNPADIVPDVIPFVGLLDDAAVVAMCLTLVERDLHVYESWKDSRA